MEGLKIGFTGTREGMTQAQKRSVMMLLVALRPIEFHHGDCIGADDEAAGLSQSIPNTPALFCHPPSDKSKRAFNPQPATILPPRSYFARNRDIVNATDELIAVPATKPLPTHGGTVYTINYAFGRGKRVHVVWPDGSVEVLQ